AALSPAGAFESHLAEHRPRPRGVRPAGGPGSAGLPESIAFLRYRREADAANPRRPRAHATGGEARSRPVHDRAGRSVDGRRSDRRRCPSARRRLEGARAPRRTSEPHRGAAFLYGALDRRDRGRDGHLSRNRVARMDDRPCLAAPRAVRPVARMTPERWRQIKEILNASVALPPAERESHLAAACAADPDLRREVDSLLVSH